MAADTHAKRLKNHLPAAKSKSKSHMLVDNKQFHIGELVFIKGEQNKIKGKEVYMIIDIRNDIPILQKFSTPALRQNRFSVHPQYLLHVPVIENISQNKSDSLTIVDNISNCDKNMKQNESSDDEEAYQIVDIPNC